MLWADEELKAASLFLHIEESYLVGFDLLVRILPHFVLVR